MYRTLIVEPQEFSRNTLLHLPIWGDIEDTDNKDGFVCSKVASNGQEALELAKSEKFDLILTEINLPFCDGLQLLKQIHKDNQPPLVVFISDIISFSYAREGFIYGAFDYLPKPVNREAMEALFKRAADELVKYKKRSRTEVTAGHQPPYFSPAKIGNIINGVTHQRREVLDEFYDMLDKLYHDSANVQQPDLIANRLYTNVIEGIYEKNDWLSLYLPQDFHRQIDYLVLHDINDYISYYQRKLTYLYDLIGQLNPMFQDETLAKVYLYILKNPEDDLKLTSVAGKFYLNHTYLSNLFSRKSNERYSQLVALVKLKRAEYLINYTSLPLVDIAEQLGYKDFHYFTRLYKKIIGKAPSDYIRDENDGFNYSI
jgi:two-component system response regulator YesN